MDVYLDDLRATPVGWERAYTANECIKFLKTGAVERLSLDHDLGVYEFGKFWPGTGYDVVKWMVENDVWPSISITLHTQNPVGRINMRQLIMAHKPDDLQVFG